MPIDVITVYQQEVLKLVLAQYEQENPEPCVQTIKAGDNLNSPAFLEPIEA